MKACRYRCSPRRSTNASLPVARLITRTSCYRQCVSGLAVTWRRKRNEDSIMIATHSDALVFFGATGDLAYKKIFPSLQAMVKRGNLNVPVIGVAKAGWNLDQLKARAKTAWRSTAAWTRP